MAEDEDILNQLYPEKKSTESSPPKESKLEKQPKEPERYASAAREREEEKITESIASTPFSQPAPNYSAKSRFEVVEPKEQRKEAADISGAMAKSETPGYLPKYEQYKGGLYDVKDKYSDTAIDMVKRAPKGVANTAEYTMAEFKREGSGVHPVQAAQGVVGGALAATGYLSETKLKLEAAKYGITPSQFEDLKKQDEKIIEERTPVVDKKTGKIIRYVTNYKKVSGLQSVRAAIDAGKAKELSREHQKALTKKTEAEARNIQSSTASRYAAIEQAQVPQGGRKLVQFGATNFGQTPVYVNRGGTHGAIRERFLPAQGTGVATSIAHSRLEIARMKERVLSGVESGGGINAVQLLQPNASRFGLPSTVSKLVPHTGGVKVATKLGSFSQPKPGPTILQKLSSFKKR